MKIVEAQAELWNSGNTEQEIIEFVCKCAQISYQSEPKKGEAAKKFYDALIKSKHLSCLRHRSYYYMLRFGDVDENLDKWLLDNEDNPYIEIYYDTELSYGDVYVYIATNGQYVYEHPIFDNVFKEFMVTPDEFSQSDVGKQMMRYTLCLTTQISTTREVPARHSPQAYHELSTRYVKDFQYIVRPHWMTREEADRWGNDLQLCYEYDSDWDYEKGGILANYILACNTAFNTYNKLINELNVKPEDARGILPLDTMTKVVCTYSIKEWKKIIDMRYYGTTGRPQPNAKVIIGLVKDGLNKLGYEL